MQYIAHVRARRGVAGTAVMLLAAIPFAVSAHAAQGDIWTTGGGGLMTTQSNVVVQSGDGGPAVQATMVQPWGVVVATDGTTFVADVSANTIRAIYPDGTIDTVAGTIAGFSGDGGPATLAQLWGPRDVDVDPAGGLIISDTENNRLRKVWPDGSITTIAGGYQQPPNLIGDGGPLLEATLRQPSGVVFAPDGEMFIREGTRIRRVDLSGTITTFAYGLVASGDLDVDSAGNLYVPDGDVIWKFDTSGSKTIFAGRGGLPGSTMDGVAATDAEVGTYHVTVAPNDDVYFTDGSGRVRRVSTGIVTTIAGGGTEPDATGCLRATLAHHLYAQGLDVDSHGDVVVAMNNLVRTIALTDSTCPSITAFTPQRVLETRLADGQIGYSGARPTPGQTVVLDLSTSGSGVPADATAASLNLTITNAVHDGYVTAWPCEAAQPITSNINVTIGATAANAVLVTLGPSNKVCLFDQAGGDLIVDVTGYVGANVPYQPLVPYRALETRPTEAMWQYHGPKPVAGQVVHVPITGWGYGDNSVSAYATAVVLNVTATDATADGYVTVW
ncbi:MAG: hypothetical protein QOJ74_1485, partial [Ilumatobacteraceae bacterium]|nr:hypothetical protein [Ilumatobacteraceae bacterium]